MFLSTYYVQIVRLHTLGDAKTVGSLKELKEKIAKGIRSKHSSIAIHNLTMNYDCQVSRPQNRT